MSSQGKRRLCTVLFIFSVLSFLFFALSFLARQNAYQRSSRDLQYVMEIRGVTAQPLSDEVKSQMDEASVRAAE